MDWEWVMTSNYIWVTQSLDLKTKGFVKPMSGLRIGPKIALYMAGAKMLTYCTVGVLMHSLGLNVNVQSYNCSLDWGLIGCREAVPNLPELDKCMQAAHPELLCRS